MHTPFLTLLRDAGATRSEEAGAAGGGDDDDADSSASSMASHSSVAKVASSSSEKSLSSPLPLGDTSARSSLHSPVPEPTSAPAVSAAAPVSASSLSVSASVDSSASVVSCVTLGAPASSRGRTDGAASLTVPPVSSTTNILYFARSIPFGRSSCARAAVRLCQRWDICCCMRSRAPWAAPNVRIAGGSSRSRAAGKPSLPSDSRRRCRVSAFALRLSSSPNSSKRRRRWWLEPPDEIQYGQSRTAPRPTNVLLLVSDLLNLSERNSLTNPQSERMCHWACVDSSSTVQP